MIKKILCAILSIVLVLTLNVTASAETETDGQVQPRLSYLTKCQALLTINTTSDEAVYSCNIRGYSGTTTKIVAEMKLQKKTLLWWSTLETTTVTVSNYFLQHSSTYDLTSSGTYRHELTITAYSGSASEELTITSAEKSY